MRNGFEASIRRDFPILKRKIRGADGKSRPLVYMDHGSSTHPPQPVLDAVSDLLTSKYANVHRGNHTLSQESSELFEAASDTVLKFVGADKDSQQVVWAQNTTMALDIAAHCLGRKGVTTLTTMSEHHSNDLTHRRAGKVLHAEIDDDGRLLLEDVERKLQKRKVKVLAVTGASNVTGLMPPIAKLARMAHDHGAKILVDAAQLYAHAPISLQKKDHPEHIDFLAAAGHKSYAPFGSAVLVGDIETMNEAPPYMPGGGTVEWVTSDDVGFTKGAERHMGGTPNITGVVAFAAATEYLAKQGMANVREHEVDLNRAALKRFDELAQDHGIGLLGPTGVSAASDKVGVFSFLVPGYYHATVSQLLDQNYGIATRNGCFCAQPLVSRLLKMDGKWVDAMKRGDKLVNLPGATRATFGIYNTLKEVELLGDAIAAIAAGKHDKPKRGREATVEVS